MTNTETARHYSARFGFSDYEEAQATRADAAACKIPCRTCGRPARMDSIIRYVCHEHFPPVYTPAT